MAKVVIIIEDDVKNNKVKASFDYGSNKEKKGGTNAQQMGNFLNEAFNQLMNGIGVNQKIADQEKKDKENPETS